MAAQHHGLLPSILDRLDDPESRGTAARSGYTIEQMAAAIEKDLERLLNTRSNDSVALKPYRLLSQVMGYGLPDLTSLSRLAEKDLEHVCRALEEKILKYEPRLKEVHITLKEGDGDPLKIQLHLRALLAVDPAPEFILDRTLDLASGHYGHS